jgi:hypothetical protein
LLEAAIGECTLPVETFMLAEKCVSLLQHRRIFVSGTPGFPLIRVAESAYRRLETFETDPVNFNDLNGARRLNVLNGWNKCFT